ncbi:acyl-CoA dehydrogenase family protein [Nocardia miyunensis]|uniref:acyl-CoA dehydrogenase family protein n=1 Tax=Nocardia miyunensis TaxID=282684 RepID=UPI0008368CCF|nr:acyl-CoA dehydrogenase family protein [Nocardia miyunensis]
MLETLRPSEYIAFREAALPIFGRLDGDAAVRAFGLDELLEPHSGPEDPRPVLAFLEAQGYHAGRTDTLGRFALTGPRPTWGAVPEQGRIVAGFALDTTRYVVPGLSESTDVVVDVPGAGVMVVPDPFAAGRPADQADNYLTLVDLTAVSGTALATETLARDFRDDLVARARLGIAAEILGACDRLLDDATAYVRTRRQFGRAIGNYQAVQHILAWAAAERYQLACLFDHAVAKAVAGDLDPALARAVKAMAGRVGHAVVQAITQATGAISFTWEYSVNRLHRRILTLDAVAGSSADLIVEMGREIRSGGEYPELLHLAGLV